MGRGDRERRANAGDGAGPVQYRDFLALCDKRKDSAEIIVNLPNRDGFHVQHDVPRFPPRQGWALILRIPTKETSHLKQDDRSSDH